MQAEAQLRIDEAAYQRVTGQRPGTVGELPLSAPCRPAKKKAWRSPWTPARARQRAVPDHGRLLRRQQCLGVLLPQVNLVGFVQYQQLTSRSPSDQFYQYGVRLQASVPIYQNGSEWSQVRQAKELVGQRRNELDSARRVAAETVITCWRQLDAARSRVVSFEAQVKANEVALNGVRQEALVGSRTTLDVLNAEQELLNAQVSLISARHDVQVAYYGVLSGIGRLTARTLGLPVEYYDEERYYKEVGSRWVGDWGAGKPEPCKRGECSESFSKSAQGAPAPGAAQQATTPGTMPASGQGTNR